MSRLIRTPVTLPTGVKAVIENETVTVTGKRGAMSMQLHPTVSVVLSENQLHVSQADTAHAARQIKGTNPMLGTTHRLLCNLVIGTTEGFKKTLLINGVGYRAQLAGKVLKLSLGFSHSVEYALPEGISVDCKSPTEVEISGNDKQLVGQIASEIRAYRKPEPYQGKGIRYSDEYIFRKETKKKK